MAITVLIYAKRSINDRSAVEKSSKARARKPKRLALFNLSQMIRANPNCICVCIKMYIGRQSSSSVLVRAIFHSPTVGRYRSPSKASAAFARSSYFRRITACVSVCRTAWTIGRPGPGGRDWEVPRFVRKAGVVRTPISRSPRGWVVVPAFRRRPGRPCVRAAYAASDRHRAAERRVPCRLRCRRRSRAPFSN